MTKPRYEGRSELIRHLYGPDISLPAFSALYNDLLHKDSDFLVNLDPADNGSISDRDVMLAVDLLREDPCLTKESTAHKVEEALARRRSQTKIDSLINLAVQVTVMVDCAAKERHSTGFAVGGYRPISWLQKETFLEFVTRSFPTDADSAAAERVEAAVDEKAALKAWKLQKRLGLQFRGTHNLSEHLLLDPRSNCLYLFHHAGFLKAQLRRARDQSQPLTHGMGDSLQRGTLPPQLLVETLHSLQSVLFPSIDQKSAEVLDNLTSKRVGGFDRECAEYEGYNIFQDHPEGFKYVYWGERLALLHEMVMSRPPRNKLERWLHRQSNEGNALFIALVALLISILVGIISIGLAAVQIWIAWMAWKHPAPGSPG
ncbi:uncharacterized protein CT0861_09246 [Colletotrichum tofieldiae]|uniref:Uncharacterized protein n=1 Tax=Colletotrichum tofieldiae TaxID=708197 RepID=A0A166RTJ1_9PEZI|nr:uncharacterized protein CT0861_09246 [Colletotrichum tofieldiae]